MNDNYVTIKSNYFKKILLCEYQINQKGLVRIVFSYKNNILGIEQLELGKGLYLSKIKLDYGYIYDIHGPKGLLYITIYHTFNKKIKGYHIHHKDYNHFNNTLDNLEYLSAKEHGNRHKWQSYLQTNNIPNEYINEYNIYLNSKKIMDNILDNYKDYNYECSLSYLKELKKQYYNLAIPYYREELKNREIKRNELKRQKELEKQKKLEEGLNNGTHIIDKHGKIVKKHKWSDEAKESAKEKRKHMYNDEYKNKVRNSVLKTCTTDEFRKRMSDITKSQMTEERRKRISTSLKRFYEDKKLSQM